MNQLLFIETFVLGASSIAAIYHLVLYIQQRDKFLMYYSVHLFTLSLYIFFKLYSNNYDPFIPTNSIWYYTIEELMQGAMVTVYILFAAQTLEVTATRNKVRTLIYVFFIFSALSIVNHFNSVLPHGPIVKLRNEYAVSRLSLVVTATIALFIVWRIRTTVFQRTIIIGSLVYDMGWLLSIISYTLETTIFGLKGVEPYLVCCLFDIIIFSSALGYRLKIISDQKNELFKKETEARLAVEKTRMRIAIDLHDDVGSVLSSMSVYGEAAKRALAANNLSKANDLIEKIGINARETMENMSDIVWTINPVNDNGIRLFNKMESFASSVLSARNIEFSFTVDEVLSKEDFLMPVRQNVFFIFKEVITNCVKHSQATQVTLQFKRVGDKLVFDYADNGKGFDVKRMHEGNGLKNIQQRAKELQGDIDFTSDKGGTKMKLQFVLEMLSA